MKICHVSFGLIKHTDLGGWLKTISYHTRVLDAVAKHHSVASLHSAYKSGEIVRNGVRYIFSKQTFIETIFLSRLIATVRAESPDAIVVHGLHSCFKIRKIVSVFRGTPIYIQHHGERLFRWPKSVMQRYNDKFVHGYFFSSVDLGHEWVSAGQIEDFKKVHELLEATSSFGELQRTTSNNSLSFLWVGRMDENKDPVTLINGFILFLKTNPEAKLFVISKDIALMEKILTPQIRGFEHSIQLVGNVPHDEMKVWFTKVNFVLSTSLFEGSGIAVLEAMSAQCIPVLTNIPSFRKITGGAVGILFEPQSGEALANALHNASKMDIIYEQKRVKEHFGKYLSAEAIANRFNEIINASDRKAKSSTLQ